MHAYVCMSFMYVDDCYKYIYCVCASPRVCEYMEIKNYPIKNRETVGHTYPNSV